ncbi:MAG: hypothetical protein WDO14_17615 [Bacteroidota bacterium]
MKDLHEDNMFDSIRERVGNYTETPSDEVWNRIASSKQGKRVLWPYWLAASTIVVLVGGFLIFNSEEQKAAEVKTDVIEIKKEQQQPVQITQVATVKTESIQRQTPSEESQVVTFAQPEIVTQTETIKPKDSIVTIIKSKPDSSSRSEVVPPYKKPRSKFQIYLSVTPSLSFQKIIPAANDEIVIQGFANRSPFSMKRFGFSIDAGLQYDINKFFGVYGGLSFYRQQQQVTYNYYDKDADVTRVGDSWTFEIDRIQHSKTFDYTMTNLGAQGGVMITLKGDKLKNKFGAGLNYTQSLNSSSSYLAYQVFYRSEIKINERFSWYVQPMFTYSFIAKEKLNEPFTLKPYRAGITGGVLYRFKR